MFDALLDYIITNRIFGHHDVEKVGDITFKSHVYYTTRTDNPHDDCSAGMSQVMGQLLGTVLTMTMSHPRKIVTIDFNDPYSFDRLLSYKGFWSVKE